MKSVDPVSRVSLCPPYGFLRYTGSTLITSKPFNHQQWSQDGKRVKGAEQTRPRVMMTGEGRQGDGEMKVVLGPVPLGYSPLPPPYPSLRPQSSLNLHLTEGIVHEGFNQLWSYIQD